MRQLSFFRALGVAELQKRELYMESTLNHGERVNVFINTKGYVNPTVLCVT